MYKVNNVIVALTLISITEIIVTEGIFGSMWLWIGYGVYRVWLK